MYDLHSGNPEDVQTALKALSKQTEEGEGGDKVLVLISSLLAWDATPKKLQEIRDPADVEAEELAKRLAEEEIARLEAEANKSHKDDDNKSRRSSSSSSSEKKPKAMGKKASIDSSKVSSVGALVLDQSTEEVPLVEEVVEEIEEIPEPVEVIVPKRKKFIHHAFTEADFQMRQATSEYAAIKKAEDDVLNFKKEGVKTYVISAGVLYGKGESIFNSHFKKAWL